MGELIERIKTYLSFSRTEAVSLLVSAVVFGFIFAFKEWNIGNFIIAVLIALLSILFHITAQKIVALKVGFKAEYKVWWYGLLIAVIFIFITNGRFWWLIIPGGMTFSLLAGLRLGHFRYGLNYWPMGIIGIAGPIASIVLGTIFKNIDLYLLAGQNMLFHKIFIFNLAYAACQMLPIPPLDGHYMFYASRLTYALIIGTVVVYTVLAVLFSVYSWIFAIIAGLLTWLTFYLTFEKGAWE